MKESKLTQKVLVAVLCIGVLAYLAVYIFQAWRDDLVTTTAYSYTQTVGVESRGVVVRQESVLPGASGYLDLILAEGERAAKGDAVALFYSDPSALDIRQSIRSLQSEIEQLQYALSAGVSDTADAGALDGQIVDAVVALRSLSASGDLSALDGAALSLRTSVFRRAFLFEDSAAGELSQLISDKQSQLADLTRSMGQVSQTVYAPFPGVFSGETDGWETVLSPDQLDGLTADRLAELLDEPHSGDGSAAGKLITGSTWYFAALLPGGGSGLTEGGRYSVSFSDGWYGEVPMTLDRLEAGDEQTLAVFSARSRLADTTLLRVQTADVILDEIEGIRVPRRALGVDTVTEDVTDEAGNVTGTKEVNHYYVYTLVSSQAEKQEVRVVYTADTYYLVRPADENARDRLRPGDEVILTTAGLFDGKVVR